MDQKDEEATVHQVAQTGNGGNIYQFGVVPGNVTIGPDYIPPSIKLSPPPTSINLTAEGARLLDPRTLYTKMVGREQEMDDLSAWLQKDKNIAIRVLTGRAGTGKTRLALELCRYAIEQKWQAGFLRGYEPERFLQQKNLAEWHWQQPYLLVLDYAALYAKGLHGGWVMISLLSWWGFLNDGTLYY